MRRLLKICKAPISRLSGELSIEISVGANPNPNPGVTWKSLRYGSIVACDANRPKARISAQSFKLERGVPRILLELFDKPRGRQPELLRTAPSKVSRSRLFLWRSPTLLKVAIFDLVRLLRIVLELLLYLVTER